MGTGSAPQGAYEPRWTY